jgi:hypothetical protein
MLPYGNSTLLFNISKQCSLIMHIYFAISVAAPKMTESEIKCGKIELALKARVIHLWSIPDRNNPAEEGSLHMLLLDEKVLISYLFYFLNPFYFNNETKYVNL